MQTIEQDMLCGKCDYNLRGLPSAGRCPECGDEYDFAGEPRTPPLSWFHKVSRAGVLTAIACGLPMGCYGALIRFPSGSNWTPEKILSSDLCFAAYIFLGLASVASLLALIVSRNVRRRVWAWLCLFAVIPGLLFAEIGSRAE